MTIDADGARTAAPPEPHPLETPPQPRVSPISTLDDRIQARNAAARPVDDFTQPFVAASTSFGGLLFLVRVLEQLGFSAFLAEHPALLESAFPERLLCAIGQRVGMPQGDPVGLAVRAQAGAGADAVAGFAVDAAPFELPAAVRAVFTSPAVRTSIETPADAWLAAVRRWCRRYPRVGLRTVIRRRATVHVTRTHIDANFALSDLDVRVRRWALDVDPGWVPWLGRVVTFTYGSNHDAR
jgi:hypothetical protein